MKVTPLSISDVLLIEPQVFGDVRGFFFESFNQNKFEEAVKRKINFVQDRKARKWLCEAPRECYHTQSQT